MSVAPDGFDCNLLTPGRFRAKRRFRVCLAEGEADLGAYRQLLRPTRPDFSRDLAISTVRKGTTVGAETQRELLRCYNCIREPRAFSLLLGNDRVTYATICARGWTRTARTTGLRK